MAGAGRNVLKNIAPSSEQEPHTFYCQVETYLSRKDHLRGGRCVRLIGVGCDDFVRLAQGEYGEGVKTFVVDIDQSSFLRAEQTRWCHTREAKAQVLAYLEEGLNEASAWFKVDFDVVDKGRSYFYSTFSAGAPTFIGVIRISSVEAPELAVQSAPLRTLTKSRCVTKTGCIRIKDCLELDNPKFAAFHVGQGMCTMVVGLKYGVMFDAGAGKPVTRERYLAGLKTNDLLSLVTDLKSIPYFVLSHFDYDHWNMLAWDKSLRDKVGTILVPKVSDRSTRSVAFFDKEVIHKVEEIEVATIGLGKGAVVKTYRTQPTASDRNGHALVSVVNIGARKALVPGDYVYSRMMTDMKWRIRLWAVDTYAAVVVPHHGDEASAKDVPPSAKDGMAFFSAGTHDSWKHPKQVSIDHHTANGYLAIHDKREENIIRKKLM